MLARTRTTRTLTRTRRAELAAALGWGLVVVAAACVVTLTTTRTRTAHADVLLHAPRGSNNRACETTASVATSTRLFSSGNQDGGGYACGRAWPFACYASDAANATQMGARDECNQQNANVGEPLPAGVADNDGVVTATATAQLATRTPRPYFYEGSLVVVEFSTTPHACGETPHMDCDVVIQYACEDTLTDDCGAPGAGKACGPRDGVPVTNSNVDYGTATYTSIDASAFPNVDEVGWAARPYRAMPLGDGQVGVQWRENAERVQCAELVLENGREREEESERGLVRDTRENPLQAARPH